MIVQENRTPDNLFGVDAATHQKLPNAHLATYGLCKPIGYSSSQQVNLTSFKLAACWDPDHSHQPAWNTMWDYGRMDGACATNVSYIGSNCQGQLARCSDTQWDQYCPQYTYVDNTLLSGYHSGAHVLDPYFQIAQDYGFANYMFQTNQGPSFPAHQFLLSGTSAPDQTPQTYFDWFAAENPLTSTGGHTGITGCAGTAGEYVFEANTTGTEAKGYTPPGYTQGFPCYDHPTLVDLIKHASLSWKYYTETNASGIKPGDSIWTAPNAIRSICLPLNGNGECNGTDWANVILPGSSQNNDASPILNDLGADGTCNLPNVSWVIPDGQ